MKKRKVLGAIAGVMAIAIAAGATYAWFVSTLEPAKLTVNAAQIKLESVQMPVDLDLSVFLPGEKVDVEELGLVNESTRESLVRVTIKANAADSKDGADVALRPELITAINDSIIINDINNTDFRKIGNAFYVFLPVGENPDDFDFSFKVPNEMGGNVIYYNNEGIYWYTSDDQPNEHNSKMIFDYEATAVQGSYQAVYDVFGQEVADEFGVDDDGTGNNGVLLDF